MKQELIEMQLYERELKGSKVVLVPGRREVYELCYGEYIQVQSHHSANPYWHLKDTYTLEPGETVLQEAGVYVVGVGWFKDRDAFVKMMTGPSFRAVILCEAKSNDCPACGLGTPGTSPLCDDCYSEYLGTHPGSHDDDPEEFAKWCRQRNAAL